MSPAKLCPLISSIAAHIGDSHPPSFSTVYRTYRNWVAAGKDIRVTIPNYLARGNRARRWAPEVSALIDSSIQDVYMTPERRRMSLWQHRVVRKNALRLLQRIDIAALAQVKADIRELIERDLNRKSVRLHKRHARFQQERNSNEVLPQTSLETSIKRSINHGTLDLDEADLPIYEADLTLPRSSMAND